MVMNIKSPFMILGTGLTLAGVMLALLAYLVLRSTPLTALGISTLIVAGVSLAFGRGQPKISPEASAILLQSGVENISAIVEELGLKSKAIYLPSSMTTGKPGALIPMQPNPTLGKVVLPKRLIVKYGPNAEDMGLLVSTPGSAVAGMVSAKTDSSEGDLEAALSLVLAGAVNLGDGAKVVLEAESVRVEVSNPRLEYRKMWIYESLGSPLASIVASVVAEVLDRPVTVVSETQSRGKFVVELKLAVRSL
jgi:hypothetical protein